jgi:hypothetical protein
MGRGEDVSKIKALLNSWPYFCSKDIQDVAKLKIAKARAFCSVGKGVSLGSASVRILSVL